MKPASETQQQKAAPATRSLVMGTAGHIDHGKTALVLALTGTDTDRLPEEKTRGITVDLGFAALRLNDAEGKSVDLSLVDVPGHHAFIHNMLAGAGGIEAVLLVVAADEGVKVTVKVALCAAASVTGVEIPLNAKPVPLIPTLEIVRVEPPDRKSVV